MPIPKGSQQIIKITLLEPHLDQRYPSYTLQLKSKKLGFFVRYSSALMTFRKTGEQDPEVKLHKHGRQMYGTEAAHPFAYFNQIP